MLEICNNQVDNWLTYIGPANRLEMYQNGNMVAIHLNTYPRDLQFLTFPYGKVEVHFGEDRSSAS